MKNQFLILFSLLLFVACADHPSNPKVVAEAPTIYPDYVDVTVPVGIAPLNFGVKGDIECMDVMVKGKNGGEITADGQYADFDIDDWHALLEQNKGGDLIVTVSVKKDGAWTQYRDFAIHVSPYSLDEWGLTYRRIAPGYEMYSEHPRAWHVYQLPYGKQDQSRPVCVPCAWTAWCNDVPTRRQTRVAASEERTTWRVNGISLLASF